MAVKFYLGNPEEMREIAQQQASFGKFVFRRDDKRFGLYLGEYASHPALVERLGLLKPDENMHEHIWGGGDFQLDKFGLRFHGESSSYGQIPNSFLIDCCIRAKLPKVMPRVTRFVFALSPYDAEDENLEARRQTWRELGVYKLDTEIKEYVFDKVCNRLVRRE